MENPDPNRNPGRKDQPGTGNDDEVGTDPRKTHERDNDRDNPRRNQPNQNPPPQNPGEMPRTG